MRPGNCIPDVKIIYDELMPLEPEGLAGDDPIDFDKELRLPIISRAIEGDDPINLDEEYLGYPDERIAFKRPEE